MPACVKLGRLLQMKVQYANEKPYGKWLDAQVATLPDLVESVPEHLLKVPVMHSRHKPLQASPIAPSNAKGSNGKANGQAANAQGGNGGSNGRNGTLSSSEEGGQVGVNASNGHSNHGAGKPSNPETLNSSYPF